MDITTVLFVMVLSAIFPLTGFYLDWRAKQGKIKKIRPRSWRKKAQKTEEEK